MCKLFNKSAATMTTGDRFHNHATKALEYTAIAYGGQCISAFGYGGMVGAAGDKQLTKGCERVVMAGGAVSLIGSIGALYHGYEATAAAIDYTADKMNELYKDL